MKNIIQNDAEFEKQLYDAFYTEYFNYIPYEDEELFQLIEKAQAGDQEIRNKIWEGNLSLIPKVVNKLNFGEGVEIDDLIQEGALAVYVAILKFDTKAGYKFSTYAFQAIRSQVYRYKQGLNHYYIPKGLVANIWTYKKSLNNFPDLTDDVRYETLKNFQGFENFQKYLNIKMLAETQYVSLNSTLLSEDNYELTELQELIPDENNLEEEVLQHILATHALDILKTLSEREIFIIEHRFGFATGSKESLQEIATQLGITRERVRQIEKKAIQKIVKKIL